MHKLLKLVHFSRTHVNNYLIHFYIVVIIARSEQELGNYKVAHSLLFDTYHSLEEYNIKILFELKRALLIVHSYVLAKLLVKNKRCAFAVPG